MSPTEAFILQHRSSNVLELALQRGRYPDVDMDFALQQIEGQQRASKKLPTLSQIEGWQYPVRLSLEQCSSETTARYKASLVRGKSLVDLTGGYGIDCLFLSQNFEQTDYVERSKALAEVAAHNFKLLGLNIKVHNDEAETFLRQMPNCEVIYLDPARRAKSGQKVVQLEDCEPNVVQEYDQIRAKSKRLWLKLSPLMDLSAALNKLPEAEEVHVVAVKNEVKEVLIGCNFAQKERLEASQIPIKAVNLNTLTDETFTFTLAQERAQCPVWATEWGQFLYEPNAAILKAGAFKTVATRFGLQPLGVNTHLYVSAKRVAHFPGRVFEIIGTADKKHLKGRTLQVMTRNYPLNADDLAHQWHLQRSGNEWLIGTRLADKNSLILARECIESANLAE